MRHGKTGLFILVCCLLPLTAYAENKKIIIPCAELELIEIKQPPPGVPFAHESCGDTCFYIIFTMKNPTAQRVNTEYNANKYFSRELYIGDHLLFTMDPFHLDAPYSQKISTAKVYPTLEGAMADAQKMCPNADIKVPDTVRR